MAGVRRPRWCRGVSLETALPADVVRAKLRRAIQTSGDFVGLVGETEFEIRRRSVSFSDQHGFRVVGRIEPRPWRPTTGVYRAPASLDGRANPGTVIVAVAPWPTPSEWLTVAVLAAFILALAAAAALPTPFRRFLVPLTILAAVVAAPTVLGLIGATRTRDALDLVRRALD